MVQEMQEGNGVSDSSKLQIQKQITTHQYVVWAEERVFPIVQSYKFKSKSQRLPLRFSSMTWCFR